jgi:hypothetical protein
MRFNALVVLVVYTGIIAIMGFTIGILWATHELIK